KGHAAQDEGFCCGNADPARAGGMAEEPKILRITKADLGPRETYTVSDSIDFDGTVEIADGLGAVNFNGSVRARGDIVAGAGSGIYVPRGSVEAGGAIKVGDRIYAGDSVRAGKGIDVGKSIEVGTDIFAELSIKAGTGIEAHDGRV